MSLLINEVDKCALLCANCHCLEHYIIEEATDIEFLDKVGYEELIHIPDLSNKVNCSKNEQAKVISDKKEVKENHCVVCGAILKQSKSRVCQKCLHDKQRVVKERPGKIQLSKMVIDCGFEAVGREYGVSGKAISKWLIAYGLPSKKKELEDWFYEVTGIKKE